MELHGQYLWNLHVLEFKSKLKSIEEQMDMNGNKLSNHKKYIEKVVEKVQKISDCGGSGDFENKIRIQNLVFPKGLSIRAENREDLTKKVNGIFMLISVFCKG